MYWNEDHFLAKNVYLLGVHPVRTDFLPVRFTKLAIEKGIKKMYIGGW